MKKIKQLALCMIRILYLVFNVGHITRFPQQSQTQIQRQRSIWHL